MIQKMNYSIKLIVIVFLLSNINTVAQEAKVSKGDKKYSDFAYVDAREAYLKVAENGYRSIDLLSRLGDSYYFTGDLENAEQWYGVLFSFSQDIDPEYMYRYAQSLKSTGKYEAADRVMEKMNQIRDADNRVVLFSEERNYLELIDRQSGRFTLMPVNFNSKLSDFAPAINGSEVIFTSNRITRGASKRLHDWNDQPFTELYSVTTGNQAEPKRLSSSLNTRYHESTACFTKDGQTMYFTRNNFTANEYQKDGTGINHLKLYKAKKNKKGWGEVQELPMNSNDYSIAHPALSPDEKTLYFASDMPGGKGMSDLYKVSIVDGTYGTPENLGDGINTEGRETFPFVDMNGDLYFASDGHVGLGGLDVFVVERNEDGSFGKGYNVGRPINSPQDDFTFVVNSITGLGYFASNRDGGMGEDDIYAFQQIIPLIKNCQQSLKGQVRNKATDELLTEAKVLLLDADNNVLEETTSDIDGEFILSNIECSKGYAIRGSKKGFSVAEKSFNTGNDIEAEIKKTLYLEAEEEELLVGQDLAVVLNLNPIYFDLSESYIRPDAEIELLKVVDAMKERPTMKIDVRSHTDSRSSDAYNLKLSEARAKSTITYLISQGIDMNRLTGKGYGESQLLNNCSNGTPCSEVDHQRNRRSEFIVVKN